MRLYGELTPGNLVPVAHHVRMPRSAGRRASAPADRLFHDGSWPNLDGRICRSGHSLVFVRYPSINNLRSVVAMKSLLTILSLMLLVGYTAPAPKNQSACEKAGMKWDSAATAPNLKCDSGFA